MGAPVRAMKRAQINVRLEKISGFPWVMFPVWFNVDAQSCVGVVIVLKVAVLFFRLSLTRNLNNTIFPIAFMNEVRDCME